LFGGPKGRDHWEDVRCRWEDNIKMNLREIGINRTYCIWLAEDRVQWWTFVNMVMTFGFHKEIRLLFDKLSNYRLFKECPVP
jgi:hypothetical protein